MTPNPDYEGSDPRCAFLRRTCLRGVLVGSFVDPKCREEASQPLDEPEEKKCKFYGVTVREGESVTAYARAPAGAGGCVSEQRTCKDGELTGSFTEPTCRVASLPVAASPF